MKYVVLGASAAGVNGARELRRLNPDAEIVMIAGDEQIYSRCILHHYVSDTRDEAGLCFAEPDYFSRYRISFIGGKLCTGLDPAAKQVILADSETVSYDKLLIATGAGSFLPPIKGLASANGVYGFRNLDDARRIKALAGTKKNIVILGGGLVGVDIMAGLLHRFAPWPEDKRLVLVEMAGHLLSKQLDKRAAMAYQNVFSDRGAEFCFDCGLAEVLSDKNGDVAAAVFNDGTQIPCDMLIVTVGVRANTQFLKDTVVATDRFGLIIDSAGRTSYPDIYGAGDVTGRTPIWPNAVKEGITAARSMSGRAGEMTDFFAGKSTMNFEGIPTMALGMPGAPDDSYKTELQADENGYKKLIHKDGRIYGAILQGDLSYAGILTQLIAHKIDISKVKKPLFDIDYSDFFHLKDNFEFYYEGVQ